jgi:hypothetical protein
MNFNINRKKIIFSLGISFVLLLFFGFFLRCFPLGCVVFDFIEIGKVFLYVFIPIFIIFYIIWSLAENKK